STTIPLLLLHLQDIMIKFCVVVVLVASGVLGNNDPRDRGATILRNVRVENDGNGKHSVNLETDNGINFNVAGEQGNMVGSYNYIMAGGSIAKLEFVANEHGYQPQSSILPVAPAFPHPIPQFVLDQIAFAEQQRQQQPRSN
ncbi:unnamed protein product, partial [Meganyctiphanes norvegica]